MRKIKVVLICVSEPEQSLIHTHLSSQKDIEITGFGKEGFDVVKLTELLKPDVILIDQQIDILNVPELVPLIKRKSPDTAVILYSSQDDDEYICKALASGISGYLLKQAAPSEIAASIRTVYNGGVYLSTGIRARAFMLFSKLVGYRKMYHRLLPVSTSDNAGISVFSQTEWKILSFIGQGRSNKEIAETLSLKPGTVRNYLSSAMHKAGLRNRIQVVLFAIKNDLLNFMKM
jgi:DNA-binding NarL/FixJ family response regulator